MTMEHSSLQTVQRHVTRPMGGRGPSATAAVLCCPVHATFYRLYMQLAWYDTGAVHTQC